MDSLIETLSHPLPGFEGQIPLSFFFMLPIFWIAVVALNKLMFEPVLATVERRKAASTGASQGATTLQVEADALARDYAARVKNATDEALSMREKLIGQARSECEQKLLQARTEAERNLDNSRNTIRNEAETTRVELRNEIERIATEMARKVIGGAA